MTTFDESVSSPDHRGWFVRGIQDYGKLRHGIKWTMTLSFIAAFLVLGWPLALWVGEVLGRIWQIDAHSPVKYQEHGQAWLVTFLVAMVAVVLVVAAVWYLLGILWLGVLRGWGVRKAYSVLVLCRYPTGWFKDQ